MHSAARPPGENDGSNAPIPSAEERHDTMREALAGIPAPSPLIDALNSAVIGGAAGAASAAPGSLAVGALVGGLASAISTWATGRGTTVAIERLHEVAWHLVEVVARMEAQGVRPRWEEESYLELINEVLPLAIRTRSEEKRRRFAILLSNAAPAGDEEREEARTMATLLHQLEPAHVLLFGRVMAATEVEEVNRFIGRMRIAPIPATGYNPASEGADWIFLHSVGLLTGADSSSESIVTEGGPDMGNSVGVTALGMSFHHWITSHPTHSVDSRLDG